MRGGGATFQLEFRVFRHDVAFFVRCFPWDLGWMSERENKRKRIGEVLFHLFLFLRHAAKL